MSRISLPDPEEMTPAQRLVYEATVAGKRGRAPLPMLAWLHSPELAARAQSLGEFVRYDTTLGPKYSELAILVVARLWTAQYEWSAHKKAALAAGLSEDIIEAIAKGQEPPFSDARETMIYRFSRALCMQLDVDTPLLNEALAILGEQGLVELVGLLGYYTLIAMTVNAFDIQSGPPELYPL